MRQLVLAAAFATTFVVQNSASATERHFLIFAWDDEQPTARHSHQHHINKYTAQQYRYATQPTYHYEQRQHGNVFEQLMDMERRKNAWLLRTFFGQD